ncbi:MAG: glycosyltransferase [Spirochaetia bacterium]
MSIRAENEVRVGFVSTRFQGLDGVSLEAAKWAEVMEEGLGFRCFWFAGQLDKPEERSMLVPEAFFKNKENQYINKQVFGQRIRTQDVTNTIHKLKEHLKQKIYEFIRSFEIDMLIAQNVLAIPMHIPLGLAVTEVIAETGIPTIAHHHDFAWERPRFLVNAVEDILQSAFPPDLPSIQHVVINSMAQKDLAARRGLSSILIYNVLDFKSIRPAVNDFNARCRKDLGFEDDDILVLQPTRVVSRKGIEQALFLMRRLEMPEAKFLISHSPGDEGFGYFHWLKNTAEMEGVKIHFIYNKLHENRKYSTKGNKFYTLWDIYPHMDFITYPSLYEGFGNAFLEAIYFKKPLIVNRYSVYIVDIEPKGFDVIPIDGFLTDDAVDQVRTILQTPERREEMVEKNFELAKNYFSYEVLERQLHEIVCSFYGTFGPENARAKKFDLYKRNVLM